ncbi:MAG: Rieske (2Fe-2S) protein [Solirubrobacterales bacterium]|nr:Rieske (2Fe-2S) protein [Solirubrobacterales bacterium]
MNPAAAPDRQMTPLEPLVRRIESTQALDGPAKALGRRIRNAISAGPFKDALSGTWLGHAVHPMLTDVVIGSFTSASLLDLLAGGAGAAASERLIMVGLAAYPPTALTGLNDWADTEVADDRVRRAGLVHASGNAVAALLYAASLAARRGGARGRGALLGLAGATVLMGGGYLGGHLSLRRGVGPDQTVFDPGSTDWAPAADAAQLQSGKPTRVVVGDTPVLLLRDADLIFAIHDRCSHRGCSLSEGQVDGEEIVCPCHGSRFDRRDGSVRHGPATGPQPAFQVRDREGIVEIRRLAD